MLAILRFTLTKELKFVHGKICKPYNSILGEHFRCHWDVQAPDVNEKGDLVPKMALLVSNPTPLHLANSTAAMESKSRKKLGHSSSTNTTNSEESSSKTISSNKTPSGGNNTSNTSESSDVSKTRKGLSKILLSARNIKSSNTVTNAESTSQSSTKSPATSVKSPALSAKEDQGAAEVDADDGASISGSFKTTKSNSDSTRRITFLTEQVSHHPPISSFWVECKEAGIELYGVDQLSAKFTGTSE